MLDCEPGTQFAPIAPLLGPAPRFVVGNDRLFRHRGRRVDEIRLSELMIVHLDTSRPNRPMLRLRVLDGRRWVIDVGSSPEQRAAFSIFALDLVIRAARCNPLLTHAVGACNRHWTLGLAAAVSALAVLAGASWAIVSGANLPAALIAVVVTPLAALPLRPVLAEGPERAVTAAALRSRLSRLEGEAT